MGIFLSDPGLVCCAGRNGDEFFESALKGDQRGIVPVRAASGETFLAGRIPGELPPIDDALLSGLPAYPGNTRILRIINTALEQIRPEIERARARYGPEGIGICIGSCDNGSEASLRAHRAWFTGGAFPGDYRLRFQGAGFPAEFISRKFGLRGPALGIAAACASGAAALIRGAELVRAGFCGAVIAGGADVVSETVLRGFNALEALSGSITNPFSKNRRGLNLGEGAAFFVLTREENPGESGKSTIELLGAGESSDAFHMTSPRADGRGAKEAREAALREAGLAPGGIDYVNLHGTGTMLNDRMEALAMASVFGEHIPPVSSTKPVTGHTLGAAGALELALCALVLRLREGLPVHRWDGVYDGEFPALPLVNGSGDAPGGPRTRPGKKRPLSVCMSNSFAFGGINTSLIIRTSA
jgi:3-oxoacyl-[acyl-carrier-protein] synthase-1